MPVIENFTELSTQEQKEFANSLIEKINTEKLFSEDARFIVTGIAADDFTGGLWIDVSLVSPIEVRRSAIWTCGNAEYADEAPNNPDFGGNRIEDAVKNALKTLSTDLEGYTISLDDLDMDAGEITAVEVNKIKAEDAGIGEYEFWGHVEYDSHPYFEVEGILTQECAGYIRLFVEAAD